MALVRFNGNPNSVFPFSGLVEEFLGDISSRTGSDWQTTIPAVNIVETKENFQLEFAAPGLQKEDFKIHVDNKKLTVFAQKENKPEQAEEPRKFNRREFNYGNFKRSFTLPDSVNADAIQAKYENGLLLLVVPKREEVKPRTITIA
jgi:HSP20 family protein